MTVQSSAGNHSAISTPDMMIDARALDVRAVAIGAVIVWCPPTRCVHTVHQPLVGGLLGLVQLWADRMPTHPVYAVGTPAVSGRAVDLVQRLMDRLLLAAGQGLVYLS